MDEAEQFIVQLAETCKKPDEFFHRLEESFEVPRNEKGTFFMEVGMILYESSYLHLALNSWNHALKYFIRNGDKRGESACYSILGSAYCELGDNRKAIEYFEKSLEIRKEIGDRDGEAGCYEGLGIAYDSLGDFRKAIEYYEKSLKIAKKIGERDREAGCYEGLGNAYDSLGDFRKAIEYYEKSLKIDKEIGDRDEEAGCYEGLGFAYGSLGDFRKAIEYFEKSLKIAKKIGDKAGESQCYSSLGVAYHDLGDFRKAIEYYEKSLKIDKEIGDRAGESECYANLSIAYDGLGDFSKAVEYREKSLMTAQEIGDKTKETKKMDEMEQKIVKLAEKYKKSEEFIHKLEKSFEISPSEKGDYFLEFGNILHKFSYFHLALNSWNHALRYFIKYDDKLGESACYTGFGNAYQSLGDFRRAIEYHEKSLMIMKEIKDRDGESVCYGNLGIDYEYLGDFKKAIDYHEKSLEIVKEIGDKNGESVCYGNLGDSFAGLGDFRKAIEYYEKSLEIAKEIGNKVGESRGYANLGRAFHNLGDFRKAIEHHEKSLMIMKEIGDRYGKAGCYSNLGNTYQRLGDFRKAIEYHEKSLMIMKEIGDKNGESVCYGNLGNTYQSLGDFRKAIEYYEKSLEIDGKIGNKVGELRGYANLGRALDDLGYSKRAIEYHEKSLEIAKEIGDKNGESVCYGNLGGSYQSLGDFKRAIEYYEKSLRIAKEIGDKDSERIGNLNLGLIYYESKPELAYDYCKHSIELSEMISGKLVEEEHKIGFHALVSDAYQYMIPLCLGLKRGKEAFEYTEKSKSRAFLDLLAATEVKPSVELNSELMSLLKDEETYLARLREIQTRHLRQTKASVEPGEAERIHENLTQIYDKIEEFDPEYAFIRRGKPLSFNNIQAMLSSQGRDVVLIEYFITKDETFIFAISSRDNKLHIKPVPVSAKRLNQYVDNYRKEVVEYSPSQDIGDTWLGLSNYLIEPVSEYIAEDDLIYFVPYSLLHYLPLHALKLNDEHLIKNHPVAYAPSASSIQFCQNKGSDKLQSCASFGVDPYGRIKDIAEKEAKDVAELFNTKARNDHLATKDNVLKNCTDKDVIHFSCHGKFDDKDPLSSGVVLYDKEVLTAKEIFDMRLNTELVTLSACQTGISETSLGDELIGLTRAFLYAGAPSVVVSLWSVFAPSTHELMLEFYTQLKNGVDKATALQQAQIKVMEKEKYSHPYYWAPFVLIGDWKLKK